MLTDKAENGIENYEQLLIEIYLCFSADRPEVNCTFILNNGRSMSNCPRPPYSAEARMNIPDCAEEKLPVFPAEILKRNDYVQKGIAQMFFGLPYFGVLPVKNNSRFRIQLLIYLYGSVNPHREIINEITLCGIDMS